MVTIVDFAFMADTVSAPVGTTITWTNDDEFDHSIVADDGSFESADIGQGEVFTHTFDAAGEYSYMCGIHPYMEGTVTVTG